MLEKITRTFASRGANPAGINGSSISQIRSNEVELGKSWELREFTLGTDGFLVQSVTAQTPDTTLNQTLRQSLQEWLNENAADVIAGKYVIPTPFLGGAVASPFTWFPKMASGTETQKKVRQVFAFNTCNGCHTRETKTGFLHIENRKSELPSKTSAFLKTDLIRREKEYRDLLCLRANLTTKPRARRVH